MVLIDIAALAELRNVGVVGNHDIFAFALAGESAEKVLLGHETPSGAAKDVREFWAWTKGRTFTSMDEYEEVLGESFAIARQRVWNWAHERAQEIETLALRLESVESVPISEIRSMALPFD